jgi:hypothetical protein
MELAVSKVMLSTRASGVGSDGNLAIVIEPESKVEWLVLADINGPMGVSRSGYWALGWWMGDCMNAYWRPGAVIYQSQFLGIRTTVA